jgi:hypothetical protein
MRLARADDPEAAAEKAAERNQKHQATHRANILFKSVYHSVLKKTL